jgi:hypothetical protein
MKYSNRNHKFLNFDLFATEATLTTPKNRLRSESTISTKKPSEYQKKVSIKFCHQLFLPRDLGEKGYTYVHTYEICLQRWPRQKKRTFLAYKVHIRGQFDEKGYLDCTEIMQYINKKYQNLTFHKYLPSPNEVEKMPKLQRFTYVYSYVSMGSPINATGF